MLGANLAPSALLAAMLRELIYRNAGRTASLLSRDMGTALAQAARALATFSSRCSSSRTSKPSVARRVIRRSSSLGWNGVSFSSTVRGFSSPRLKPDPTVALISCAGSPIVLAAALISSSARFTSADRMCAWRPSENAALFSVALRRPGPAACTSRTAVSVTLSKYADTSHSPFFVVSTGRGRTRHLTDVSEYVRAP